MSEKIDSNSSEKLKLGDALKKYFDSEYVFDETWADMGAGFLYRRQVECIKFKYIFKLVNEVKKIKTKNNKMILKKYIDYKNKFFIYRELQAGKPSKALYHMKNLKEIKKQISDDKLTGDYIYKYLKNSILEYAYRDLKEMQLKLLDRINNFLKKRSSNKKYREQIKNICIAKEIITYYEHDFVKLNNKNKDQYGEIYKFKNDECIKYKLDIYSNNIFRWFSDEKKEWIKNLLHSFLKDIYDFGESANKIELGNEVLDKKKMQMATIGCYDENTPECTVKQTLDIIVLRFVLEAMKLEYFVHIPYSRQITRKLTTKSTTKVENLQEKIMPNLFLESKMNEIEDLQDTINIFYKTNIFDEMIKILNKSIEANLIKFEEDKKIDENSKARFRKKIRKILKDSLDPENLQDSLYTALYNHAKKIKRSKD